MMIKIGGSNHAFTNRTVDKLDRKSTSLNSSHVQKSRMPSYACKTIIATIDTTH